jgi:acetamidase/formamidase
MSDCGMATHRLQPTTFHNTIATRPAALTVASGDIVVVQTLDAHGFDGEGRQRGAQPNPMTGPIAVSEAEPGDTLAVDIRRVTPVCSTGWTRSGLAWHVVDPEMVRDMPERAKIIWSVDRNKGEASLKEAARSLPGWSMALDPMIGCLGVAPAHGEALSTATCGPHGGNMDYRMFRAGTTAYFPVSVPGALFHLGDAHALQGDGEIAGTGIEIPAEIEVGLRIIKARPFTWPRGETAEHVFTVGNARPLEQALQHATSEMLRWLESDFTLDRVSASHLLGMAVRYDIGNVFNPAYTVACRLEKSLVASFARRA